MAKAKAKPKAKKRSAPKKSAKPTRTAKAKSAKSSKKAKQPARQPAKQRAKPKQPKQAKPNRPKQAKPRHELPEATPEQLAAQPLIDEAMAAADAGNLERAAELMLVAADTDPSDWRLPNEAGVFYYRLERYDDALRCYDRTLAIAPGNVPMMMNKALVFILTNRDDEALVALQAILAIDPIYAPAYFEIGKLHQKQGKHQDAIEYFDTALVHETLPTMFNVSGAPPRDSHLVSLVMLNKARAFIELEREDDAVAQAQTLMEQLGDASSLMKLANELATRERKIAATRVIDVLLASEPDHAEARQLRERL